MQNTAQGSGASESLWWNKPIIYWQPNQVAITFHSPVSISGEPDGPMRVIKSLKLDILAKFLDTHGFQLMSYTPPDLPHPGKQPPPEGQDEGEPVNPKSILDSPVGKYLFTPASGQGTLAICYFHSSNPALAPTMPDSTRAIVRLLNQNLDTLKQHGMIPIVAAMPNWMGGGTPGGITVNCPACPPIPLTGDVTKKTNWHFTLPQLSPTLQDQYGDGVTAFVLDTIPKAEHIKTAAASAGDKNVLLKSIEAAIQSGQIVIDHQEMPDRLAPDIQAGKDLNGTLYGFNMLDHGLFVAGIIHDLVPNAQIACVRVLNDYGVGDTAILIDALHAIQEYMAQGAVGQVVVNLSLEVSPSDANLPGIWFGGDCCCFQAQDLPAVIAEIGLLRAGLHHVIQSLTAQGAIIVASSGNESNMNNHPPVRYGPRYPAAFPEVIAVGAVDNAGKATTYSDYPSVTPHHNGVAVYGGAIPRALLPGQPGEPAGAKTWAKVDDAVVGVYSSHHYPMLLASDEPPEGYHAPAESHCWAYWSGTSFATPVISSLAVRVLEAINSGKLTTSMSIEDVITTAPGQKLLTSDDKAFPNMTGFGVQVGMLQATQTGS